MGRSEGFSGNNRDGDESSRLGQPDFSPEGRAARMEMANAQQKVEREVVKEDWSGSYHTYKKIMRGWGSEAAATTRSNLDFAGQTRYWMDVWKNQNGKFQDYQMKDMAEAVMGLWHRAFRISEGSARADAAELVWKLYQERGSEFIEFLRSVLPIEDWPNENLVDRLHAVMKNRREEVEAFQQTMDWEGVVVVEPDGTVLEEPSEEWSDLEWEEWLRLKKLQGENPDGARPTPKLI